LWTVPIPKDDVEVHLGAGKAEMEVENLPIPDYGTKANSLGPQWQTAFDPGVVSLDVVWSGPITRQVHVTDGTLGNNYAGEYVENQVTVTWSGTNLKTGVTFTANPGTFATSAFDGGFAELGHERNGSFVAGEHEDDDAGSDAARPGDRGAAALPGAPGSSSPATPQTNLLPTSRRAEAPAATLVETAQLIRPTAAPDGLAAVAAHRQALDQVFAGLDGDELADVL
jgi:hypothetical protein